MHKQLLYLISFSAVIFFSSPVSSQQVNPCGTNEMLEIEMEKHPEIKDLRNFGVSVFTMGQYLQPSIKHLPVVEFIEPKQFQKLKEIGLEIGFRFVESGPLVRSSYHAEKHLF